MSRKKAAVLILVIMAGGQLFAQTLTVRIENAAFGKGTLSIGLYDKPDVFTEPDEHYAGLYIEAAREVTIVTIPDVPKGTYAAAIYQDKNGNGKLDTFLGIPTEKYGFSNNTMIPSWDKNSFVFDGDKTITVRLR